MQNVPLHLIKIGNYFFGVRHITWALYSSASADGRWSELVLRLAVNQTTNPDAGEVAEVSYRVFGEEADRPNAALSAFAYVD